VPGGKPEPEHRGSEECGHEYLDPQRGGAHRGRALGGAQVWQGAGEQITPRAVQQPHAGEHQGEHRRPAQQPVVAVDQQGHEAVGALDVAQREGGVGGRLPAQIGGVGGGPAVQGLVHRHVERHAEEGHLDRPQRERAPPGPQQRPHGVDPDHDPGRDELGAQPGKRAQQREAHERLAARNPVVEPEGEQRGACERRGCGELGVHGAAVGQQGRREPGGQRGAERPRVAHHAQRQPVGQRHRQGRDRGQEDLHPLRPRQGVGRRDQQRQSRAMGLVQPPLGLGPVAVQLVGVELRVRTLGVVVFHVEVAVLDQRLRREQVVGLVAAVLGCAEGV